MCLKISRLFIFVASFIGVLSTPYISRAQEASLRVVSSNGEGVTFEMVAAWQWTMRAALDSAAVTSLTPRAVYALDEGVAELSELVYLPSLQTPRVELLESSYDEIGLSPDQAFPELVEEYETSPFQVHGLGMYRKKPVVSLATRMLQYDPSSSTIRRYRRMLLRVSFRNQQGQSIASSGLVSGAVESNGHLQVETSALADGTVLKIPITREGIYRIDRSFLSDAELDPDTIDPDKIQILGNGGAPLPALNSDERPIDLVQNPVFVRGGGDGSFSDNDVVLFYGAAPSGWRYVDNTDNNIDDPQWEHYVNPFSNENYYFLKISNEDGLRVDEPSFDGVANAVRLDRVTGRVFVDFDQFNWSKQNGSGLTWISSPIEQIGRLDILVDSIPPGFQGGEVQYQARAAVQSNPAAFAVFNSDNGRLASARAGIVQPGDVDPSARLVVSDFTDMVAAGQAMSLSMTLEAPSGSPLAALDWMRATYDQVLEARNGVIRFSTPVGNSGPLEFFLTGFNSQPQVWDITEPGEITRLGVQSSGGGYLAQINVPDGRQPRELIAFVEGVATSLDGTLAEEITPQNLHGIQDFPEFAIITPELFRPYAEELAAIRRDQGLRVIVVDIDKIYNEFSGGLVDMRAVRDYLRFLYDRAPSDDLRLKYALFYGDGHFNYRNLGTGPSDQVELTNWIPPYETVDSFTPEETFTSDDYFGLLDASEGLWVYTGFSSPSPTGNITTPVDRLDIGIGRFTVQTEEDARAVLDKLKRYENPETYGSWRTRYTFIADDDLTGLSGTTDDADLHLQNADVVAELVKDEFAQVNVKKIYASSFQRVFRNGFKIPSAREEIISALDEGSLLVNYSGHGGEDGLAQEGIFTAEDARNLENFDRLAIFITATCSFGWWDLASYQSGAEELLLNPNGGAVALLTTVRLVYTSSVLNTLNVGLNRQLARDMFELDEGGQLKRLGDILRETKNTRVGIQGNNRKFNLLGDPTLRVGIPGESKRAEVETINGVDITQATGQLRALDRVTVTGSLKLQDGTVDDTYNGIVELSIFDAEREIPIKNQRFMSTPYYTVQEDLIWRGEVQAQQGLFDATFVVPKDISYSNLSGRLSLYAYSGSEQILGYTENFLVGGTSDNPPDDSNGPEISLFLNDTTFVSGGLTAPSPRLIVKLFDESGINTVGAGVGHEMLLTINDDAENAVDISSGFKSEANSFQRGTVEWELTDLQPGSNSISLRTWDVLNNSSTAAIDFFVAEDEDLVLRNVYNYPNPTSGETLFVFEHNQPLGTNASVQVRIYTLSGRLVRNIEVDEMLPGGVLQLPWDGRDEDTDLLATGVYLYKLRVEVENPDGGRQVSEKIEKLAIIR